MFHNLLVKVGGFILGTLSVIFPFFIPHTYTHNTISSSTPTTKTEAKTPAPIQLENSATSTQTTATTTPQKTSTTTQDKKVVEIPAPAKPQTLTLTKEQFSAVFDQINMLTRATLVNILCITKTSGPFSSASGSGVIITSDGVILTNAHIGQFLLLKDFNGQKDFVTCTIRTGSPAYPSYKAELVYISPEWIKENKTVLTESNPTGTGQYDYAFLKIISNTNDTPVTDRLAYMPISINENINIKDNMLLASYPAGFLGGISIEKDLYQSSAVTQVAKIFTFATGTIDLISVPGTVVSQKGSSGGAVVDNRGELSAIITTSSEADTTGARDLRAITLAYINRDLTENAGMNLKNVLENSQAVSDAFNQTVAETLTKTLTDAILNR